MIQTTQQTTPATLYVIDYRVKDASPETLDRTNSVVARSLRDAIDIIECDFRATKVHAVYDANGVRLY